MSAGSAGTFAIPYPVGGTGRTGACGSLSDGATRTFRGCNGRRCLRGTVLVGLKVVAGGGSVSARVGILRCVTGLELLARDPLSRR